MKYTTFLALTLATVGSVAQAQTNQPADDWKPSSSNLPGQQYPEVNSQGCVRARIRAPQAQNVQLDISGVKFPLNKGADGFWTGDSTSEDEGNHYYGFVVDGAEVPDPNGSFIFGSGAWRTDIEIPAADQDFYALKNVLHGQLREIYYFGKTSGTIRHSFVYTPPGYDINPNQRYPVLYLLHGYNENESGWGHQGHVNFIMDNLIAQGRARPFIIVMENGGMSTHPGFIPRGAPPAGAPPGGRGRGMFDFSDFEHALIGDVIPFIDDNFRTMADQPDRAIAGFSMGGMQAHNISMKQLDTFSYIGIFSGGSISTNEITDVTAFKKEIKLMFVSYGSRELGGGGGRGPLFGGNPQTDIAGLQAAGINARFYVSPDTAHEWQTWRRSLHEFAPLLFKEP